MDAEHRLTYLLTVFVGEGSRYPFAEGFSAPDRSGLVLPRLSEVYERGIGYPSEAFGELPLFGQVENFIAGLGQAAQSLLVLGVKHLGEVLAAAPRRTWSSHGGKSRLGRPAEADRGSHLG